MKREPLKGVGSLDNDGRLVEGIAARFACNSSSNEK
jgi:hypothetical protein